MSKKAKRPLTFLLSLFSKPVEQKICFSQLLKIPILVYFARISRGGWGTLVAEKDATAISSLQYQYLQFADTSHGILDTGNLEKYVDQNQYQYLEQCFQCSKR